MFTLLPRKISAVYLWLSGIQPQQQFDTKAAFSALFLVGFVGITFVHSEVERPVVG